MQRESLLIPKRTISNLIGSLCKKPRLYFEMKPELKPKKDLNDIFYVPVYKAVARMIINNPEIEKITEIDIDNAIAQDSKEYSLYNESNGFETVRKIIKASNPDLFHQNYETIRKFSLLRDFNANGFSVRDILDLESLDLERRSQQIEEFEKMTLDDIINIMNNKLINVKNRWNLDGVAKSYKASDGIDSLLDSMNEKPDYGIPFANKYYNTIFRGMRRGKLLIRSAGTGGSKTRNALADLVMACCDELYDFEKKDFVRNGICNAGTFISTELELKELQTCMLAIITGVNEKVIKDGHYSEEVAWRLSRGVEIIKRSSIHLHYIPDFTVQEIEQIIEKDILTHNVCYVWFDYIQNCSKLSKSTSQNYGGLIAREDQILLQLSSSLKLICDKYNVFMGTSTQLNRNAKEHDMRDTTAIRGGSAIIDKANFATMMFRTTAKDIQNLEHILKTGRYKKPTFCHYVYKNRDGMSNIIIWTIMNMGNMREETCFCTNMDFELLTDIAPMEINMDCEPIKK